MKAAVTYQHTWWRWPSCHTWLEGGRGEGCRSGLCSSWALGYACHGTARCRRLLGSLTRPETYPLPGQLVGERHRDRQQERGSRVQMRFYLLLYLILSEHCPLLLLHTQLVFLRPTHSFPSVTLPVQTGGRMSVQGHHGIPSLWTCQPICCDIITISCWYFIQVKHTLKTSKDREGIYHTADQTNLLNVFQCFSCISNWVLVC